MGSGLRTTGPGGLQVLFQLTVSDFTSLLLKAPCFFPLNINMRPQGLRGSQYMLRTHPMGLCLVVNMSLKSLSIMILEDAPGTLLWPVPTQGSSGLLLGIQLNLFLKGSVVLTGCSRHSLACHVPSLLISKGGYAQGQWPWVLTAQIRRRAKERTCHLLQSPSVVNAVVFCTGISFNPGFSSEPELCFFFFFFLLIRYFKFSCNPPSTTSPLPAMISPCSASAPLP